MTRELKEFAPGFTRDELGYIHYPRDSKYRMEWFCKESFKHPAKMNCYQLESLVDYVSELGEVILDPMSGTGTLMLATLTGRKVILIEEAGLFHIMQKDSRDKFPQPELITMLYGPCQEFLPLPCDHVIFSPPYSTTMAKVKASDKGTRDLGRAYMIGGEEGTQSGLIDYLGDSDKNLARFNPFYYGREMEKIYKLLFDSVRVGGSMSIVIQDQMEAGQRIELSTRALRMCINQGWEFVEWFNRYTPGTGFKSYQRSKGVRVVDNECMLVFRKPTCLE